MLEKVIERYGEPGKLDEAPHLTICKTHKDSNGNFDVYLQVNKDDTNPQWQFLGVYNEESWVSVELDVNKFVSSK